MQKRLSQKTKVIIFSGPGGVGKTTLIERLMRKPWVSRNFIKGVSFTTRPKRQGEKEGKDYFFVSKERFLALQKKKYFLESQKVADNYYASAKAFYAKAQKAKKDLILCIDVNGGLRLKKILSEGNIATIFISAPSEHDLYKRLEKRVENKRVIAKRIALAKKELSSSQKYDYFVINKEVIPTIKILEAILVAEKIRR